MGLAPDLISHTPLKSAPEKWLFQHTGDPQRQPPMRCAGGHAPRRKVAALALMGCSECCASAVHFSDHRGASRGGRAVCAASICASTSECFWAAFSLC